MNPAASQPGAIDRQGFSGPGHLTAATGRRAGLFLMLLLLMGTVSRVTTLWIPPFEGPFAWRQYDTAAIARNFSEGPFQILYPQIDWRGNSPGYVESEFPLYPAIVAVLYRVGGSHEWIGRAVNVAVYIGSALLLFALVRRLMGEAEALWAVFFYSVLPLSFIYTRTFQPDALGALGSLAGIYFFFRWTQEERKTHLALSAAGTCVAILIKPFHICLGIPLLWMSWRRFGWRRFTRGDLWLCALAALGPAVLWYIHAAGLWYMYGNTFTVFVGPPGLMLPGPFDPLRLIAVRPLALIVIGKLLTPPGALLLLAGIFLGKRDSSRVLAAWTLGFMLVAAVAAMSFMHHEYYLLSLSFVAAAWMGAGSAALWRGGRMALRTSRGLLVLLLALLLLSSTLQIRELLRLQDRYEATRSLDARVERLTEPDALVIFLRPYFPREQKGHNQHRTAQGEFCSSLPRDFYLSHRKGFSLDADAATPEFIETLRKRGARYLATPYLGVFEQEPLLAPSLAQRYQLLALSPEGALYRLEAPSPAMASSEVQKIPAPREPEDQR
jgi:hypothetical protein